MWYVTTFAVLLLILQFVTRTDLVFSLGCFFFVVITGLAFNVAGGFSRPSGAYIFFFAMLTAIVGMVSKVFFLEPGQSHLQVPIATIESYVGAALAILAAAYLSRKVSRPEALLQNMVPHGSLQAAAIGCVIAGFLIAFVAPLVLSSGTETVLTPIFRASNQLNRFFEMAIILGVTYQIKNTGDRRTLSPTVVIAWAAIVFQGAILGYSKQAIFGPFVAWLVAAAVQRHQFRPLAAITAALLFLFCFVYMVPYCQVGRVYRDPDKSIAQNFAVSVGLLEHLGDVKRLYEQEERSQGVQGTGTYFDVEHGLIDRLQMLSVDDTLHVVTDQTGPLGMQSVWAYVANAIPRVIWKNKPIAGNSNLFGHELGWIAPDDMTTSVSVGPVGESYRIAQWGGILVLSPILWFILFAVFDTVCGDPRKSPWGILALVSFAHIANEGGVGGQIYMLTFGLIGILFVAFCTAYVLPHLSSFILAPKRAEYGAPHSRVPIPR